MAFFAPNPGKSECILIYRDQTLSEDLTCWKVVNTLNDHWSKFIWNPSKRKSKMVNDAVGQLRIMANKLNELNELNGLNELNNEHKESIIVSTAYIYLLNCVLIEKKINKNSTERQFAVVEYSGFRNKKVITPFYLSELHCF